MRGTGRRLAGPGVADQLLAAAAAGGLYGQHGADVPSVELVLGDLGLQRNQVFGQQRPLEVAEGYLDLLVGAQDLGLVLGLALVVLLPVGHAVLGIGWHDDPGLRPVDAGLERARPRRHLAVLILGGVLAQVPDVAGLVLGVPVVGNLDELTVLGDDVVDDPGLDPVGDLLRPVGDGHLDALFRPLRAGLPVAPPVAGGHRPVGV